MNPESGLSGVQARQKAEAAAEAAQQQLERESSRDHAAFEAEQDSTDQGGDEGVVDAEQAAQPDQEHVQKLQQALENAQVGCPTAFRPSLSTGTIKPSEAVHAARVWPVAI